MCVIIPNLVALGQTVRAYIGSQKYGGRWVLPLGVGRGDL